MSSTHSCRLDEHSTKNDVGRDKVNLVSVCQRSDREGAVQVVKLNYTVGVNFQKGVDFFYFNKIEICIAMS